MRKLLILTVAAVLVTATASAAPSPILDFDLTQGSGTTVIDSANGVVGTTHGTLWSTDPSGMPVLYFDNPIVYWFGDGDYFEIPYHNALNSPTMSIEVLVYPMSCGYYTQFAGRIRNGGTWESIMTLALASTGYHTGRAPFFGLTIGGIWKGVQSPNEIPLNAWSHIVGTYDGNDMRLYVNGILVATEFGVGGPRDTGSNPLYLGHAPTSNHYFNGFYAAFKLYDRALTAEEIGAEFTAPPVANANGPYLGAMGAEIGFDGTGSSDPDGDPLTYDWDWGDSTASPDAGATPTHAYGAAGTYDVCLTVTDPYAASDTACTYAVAYEPNVAPTVTLTGPTGANEGDTKSYSFTTSDPDVLDTFSLVSQSCGANGTLSNAAFNLTTGAGSFDCLFPDGPASSTVSVQVKDSDDANSNIDSIGVTIANVAPTVTLTGPTSAEEGSPVVLVGSATDPAGANDTISYDWSVTKDGNPFANGTGVNIDFTPDDNGTYVATLTASDEDGGSASTDHTVAVANVAPTLGSIAPDPEDPVVAVDTPVSFSAPFSDPAGAADAPYSCNFDWDGDGTVDETIETTYGTCNGSHAYEGAGVYTVRLTVTDKDGADSNESIFEFVVAYDPSAGFVTGGGWIMSPAGAYYADPNLEGKATFGFVSKYQSGANVPTGNTEFQFKAGDLNFHSTSYDWLVVTGSNYARFKGTGTINGAGEYKFMIWAGDGTGSDGADTFRIKIWVGDEDSPVYDNGMDQAIGGGSIVVHTR